MRNFFRICIAATVFISCSAFAKTECYAVIVNHSNAAWTFKFSDPNCSSCALEEQVQPHSNVAFLYPFMDDQHHEYDLPFGVVEITDANGKMKYYRYSDTVKHSERVYSNSHRCPYIQHDDEPNTGGVSVNEPNFGSFIIEHDTW